MVLSMENRRNPYNFVPQSEKIISRYSSYEELPSHAVLANGKELLSGVITCTLKAETPVCVGNGKQEKELADFAKDAEGRYIIPGSSVRGVVRTNMLTLGLCPMRSGEDFTDSHFLYRDFSSKNYSVKWPIRINYLATLLPNGISLAQPCYLRKEGKYYVIHRAQCKAIDRHIVDPKKRNEYQDRIQKARREKRRELRPYELTELQEGLTITNPVFKGIDPLNLCARELAVWYREDPKGNVTSISIKETAEGKKGVLLAPGHMRKQNKLYLFADFQEDESPVVWKEEDRIAYQMDYKRRERTLNGTQRDAGQSREFWKLPEDDRPLPFFRFGISPEPVILGRSPYLRIAYRNSVRSGLLPTSKKAADCLDYVSALFGFVSRGDERNAHSYKSRLSFESFTTSKTKADKRRMLPGNPSASSFADYLLEGGTYNSTNFTLRGVKHYWLHDHANEQTTGPDTGNQNTQRKEKSSSEKNFETTLSLLPTETEFTGNIRFKNLHRDELGLLLWCLWLGKDCYQTIGKGKALGYGRMKLTIDRVAQECPDVLYSPQYLEEGAQPERELNAEELINEYKAYVEKQYGITLSDYEPVQDLLYIHSQLIADEAVAYPSIREYQNRMTYLPTLASYRLGRQVDPDVAMTTTIGRQLANGSQRTAGRMPDYPTTANRQNGGTNPANRSTSRRGSTAAADTYAVAYKDKPAEEPQTAAWNGAMDAESVNAAFAKKFGNAAVRQQSRGRK